MSVAHGKMIIFGGGGGGNFEDKERKSAKNLNCSDNAEKLKMQNSQKSSESSLIVEIDRCELRCAVLPQFFSHEKENAAASDERDQRDAADENPSEHFVEFERLLRERAFCRDVEVKFPIRVFGEKICPIFVGRIVDFIFWRSCGRFLGCSRLRCRRRRRLRFVRCWRLGWRRRLSGCRRWLWRRRNIWLRSL